MSPKTIQMRSSAEHSLGKSLTIDNGSDSGCSIDRLNRIQTASKEDRLLGLAADQFRALSSRFWSNVDRSAGADACWPWQLSCLAARGGHGQFTVTVDGKQWHYVAHRIAWLLTHRKSAGDLKVCHVCDNPPCCNPIHHFQGSQADNLDDARAKGRLVDGRHKIKLSDAALAHIKATYLPRVNGRALAARYEVTLQTIMRVVNDTARVQQQPLQTLSSPFQQSDRPFDLPSSPFQFAPSIQVPVVGEVR